MWDKECVKKLIQLYCTICQCNDNRFIEKLQHRSNNKSAQFTDKELITAFLWGKEKGFLTRKAIYNFIKDYHLADFPRLPSYQAFCRRLNRLTFAIAALAEIWMEEKLRKTESGQSYVLDSCPVIVSSGPRANRAKTAREICNLTRNSTRNLWYHGVKLHVFALLRPGKLPIPCAVQVSKASYCDLWAAKQIIFDCDPVRDGTLYADRAYIDADWKDTLKTQANIDLVTPRKKKKCDTLRFEDAASTFISGLRQPIEIYFNWLNVRTAIQNASHVRSTSGLLFHIFASLAFAAYCQLFYY